MELPKGQSAFLWGARKTGKSTYLKLNFPESAYFDLLKSDLFLSYSKRPELFREEVLALASKKREQPIIIDEIQRIPELLNEVHWMIENQNLSFILCGSSARKLKRMGVNLLGGRAWRFAFFPLTSKEIPDFDLLHALNNGLVPSHYEAENARRSLKGYVEDYLTHEIQTEGLVRNLPAFARFLDSLPFSNGEQVNFTNIAAECGVSAKTAKEYYQILVDTLLGYFLLPYRKQIKRRTLSEIPKFYLFDVGLASYLSKRKIESLKGAPAGDAFEHFIFMELIAYRSLLERDFEIYYWRTNTGLETDFILGQGDVAIEVKISSRVEKSDVKGLAAFAEEHKPSKALVISLDSREREIDLGNNVKARVLPYKNFLEQLWTGKII